ncbi:STAS domain-containing protein [Pseudonocardia lacus]|uniref:STAS domain-containing protein n=1 Tax=Pseudonocardia lacus TaxID=2835865 RepID=UPI001BDCB433|nr:MEDS domain-containing protein [Pseudonocardia lacus]
MSASNPEPAPRPDDEARRRAVLDRPAPPPHTMLLTASPCEDRHAVDLWVTAALRRGERAVCLFDPAATSVEQLSTELAGAAIGAGRVLLLDAAAVAADTGGSSDGLWECLAELAARSGTGEGRPVNVTADEAALRRCLGGGDDQLDEFERTLDRLTEGPSVRVLCRYPERDGAGRLRDSAVAHHRAVLDHMAAIERTGDTLRLSGAVDLRNLARVRALLDTAHAAGVRRVDLSGLRFCCAAGVAALAGIDSRSAGAEDGPGEPDGVVLIEPTPAVRRVLAVVRRG